MKIYLRFMKITLIIFAIFSIMTTVGYGYGSSYGGSYGGNSGSNSGSSSGSSGGGTRVITTSNVDPYSNIAKHETIERNLIANQFVEYSFKTPEFSIYQILLNNSVNEYDIPVRIEDLKNTSKYAKPAPGIVYINENVWLGSTRVNYISIMFRVKNSWIKENALEDDRLPYLLKWNGTVWYILKTNMTGKDDTYTYFESPKAGNSRIGIFAISAPLRRVQTVNVASKNGAAEQYEEIIPSIEEIDAKDSKRIPGFGAITVILCIILVIYVKKKDSNIEKRYKYRKNIYK